MGIFNKSRKTVILNSVKGLSHNFYSKTMDLSQNKLITDYEMNVLLFLFLGAKGLIESLFTIENSPLYKMSDKDLGLEGNALNAYYNITIFLLYIHDQRVKNKKELKKIADTDTNKFVNDLEEILLLKKSYVKDYFNHLLEMHKKFEGNTLEVFNYQIVLTTQSLMADGRNVKEVFDKPDVQLFLPMTSNIHLIELTKALDKVLGISKENEDKS